MSDIKTVWEGQFIKVNLVDTTTECTVVNNVYSLTEMMDLHQELVQAFDVTVKELEKLNHVSVQSMFIQHFSAFNYSFYMCLSDNIYNN